jgi:hypothetical protein
MPSFSVLELGSQIGFLNGNLYGLCINLVCVLVGVWCVVWCGVVCGVWSVVLCDRPRAARWNEDRKGKSGGMADGLSG